MTFWLQCLVSALLGLGAEVVFTAATERSDGWGYSRLQYAPAYAAAPLFVLAVAGWPLPARLALYAAVFLVCDQILRPLQTTAHARAWALAYMPAWMLLGWVYDAVLRGGP